MSSIAKVKEFIRLSSEASRFASQREKLSEELEQIRQNIVSCAFRGVDISGETQIVRLAEQLCVLRAGKLNNDGADVTPSLFMDLRAESELPLPTDPDLQRLVETLLSATKAETDAMKKYSGAVQLRDHLETEVSLWLKDNSIVVEEGGSYWIVESYEYGVSIDPIVPIN